jgi:TRAP-type C4-dicarboxylate transport system permease small subunit
MNVLLLVIVLVLIFGVGGGYYGHRRWGTSGSAGIGLGTVLLIILVGYMLGLFR